MRRKATDFLAWLFCASLPAVFYWLFLRVWLG